MITVSNRQVGRGILTAGAADKAPGVVEIAHGLAGFRCPRDPLPTGKALTYKTVAHLSAIHLKLKIFIMTKLNVVYISYFSIKTIHMILVLYNISAQSKSKHGGKGSSKGSQTPSPIPYFEI